MLTVNSPEWVQLAILGALIYGGITLARNRSWRGGLRALRQCGFGIKDKGMSAVRRVNMIPAHSPKARVRT